MRYELQNRMEGLCHDKDHRIMLEKLQSLTEEWLDEGFEGDDVKDLIASYVKSAVYDWEIINR